jgi:arylsulfatase I/J
MANDKRNEASVNRRNLLLTSGAAIAVRFSAVGATTLAAGLVSGTEAKAGTAPNIIFILADDLGWKDVGYHGSDIKTPNIDKLAETGARLEEYYVQPMCTPTRAALMTGRYPMRYGLQTAVIPSGGTYGLATDEFLLPQLLKEAGYQTATSASGTLATTTASIGRASAVSITPTAP